MAIRAVVSKKDEIRVFRNMNLLLGELSHHAGLAGLRAAQDYASLVKSGIGTRATPSFVGTPWAPLSDYWKKVKTAHKDEFWIETGGISRNVKTDVVHKFLIYQEYFAGIKQSDDPEAFERAVKNEFGFGLGPARPLFVPAIEFFTRKMGDTRHLKRKTLQWKRFKDAVKIAIRKVYR